MKWISFSGLMSPAWTQYLTSTPLERQPFVFRDPTDDGPEVDILRAGKVIMRQGDAFVLGYPSPRVKGRYF